MTNQILDNLFSLIVLILAFYGAEWAGWDFASTIIVMVWAGIALATVIMIAALPIVWAVRHVRITIV